MKCEKCIKNGVLNELEEIVYTLPAQIKYCRKCNSYFVNTNDFLMTMKIMISFPKLFLSITVL